MAWSREAEPRPKVENGVGYLPHATNDTGRR